MQQLTPVRRVLFRHCPKAIWVGLFATFSILLSTFFASTPVAQAATDNTLNFQARLETSSGSIVPDGNYNIEFKITNDPSTVDGAQGVCSGSCLWVETRTSSNQVRVTNGYLSVNLGSVNAFPTNINWDQNLYLTMNIGGTGSPSWDGEMSPRLQLTGVPYAFRAGQLAQYNSTTGFTSTLSLLQPTGGNQTFQVPDMGAAGTYTLLTTQTANGSYIQNQNSGAQTANFWINGTGIAGTALQTPTLDATTAGGTLAIGSTNANTGNVNIGIGSTTGAITIGGSTETGNINIGTGTGVQALNFGTGGTGAKTVTIGSQASSSSLTLDAGTGAINIGTSASARNVNIATGAAAQAVIVGSANGGSSLTLQSGTGTLNLQTQGTGGVNIATNAVAQTVTIGNTTGTSAVTIQGGTGAINIGTQAVADTITLGNSTGASSVVINDGTGALNIGTNAIAHTVTLGNATGATSVVANCGTGACSFGANATAHTTTVGSTSGASATTIQSGTGNLSITTQGTGQLNIGNNAVAQTINIGNATGATTVSVLCGTGAACGFGNNTTDHSTTIGSTTGVAGTTIQAGSGGLSLSDSTGAINLTGGAASTWSIGSGNALTITSSNFNVSGGATTLGSSSSAGSLVLQDGAGKTATLQLLGTLSANQTYSLPTAGGTICIQASAACGFESTTGTDFIQNQNATTQTGNFNISGTGTMGALLVPSSTGSTSPSIDTTTAGGTLNIGTNNVGSGGTINLGWASSNPVIQIVGGNANVGSPSLCGSSFASNPRFCVAKVQLGSGSGTAINSGNVMSITNTGSGSKTDIGQDIVISDNSASVTDTIYGLNIDTTTVTNSASTVDSIQATAPAANAGNLLQLNSCSGISCGTVANVLLVNNTGNITATGTYNGNTFTSSALTFAGASTVSTSSGQLTLQSASGAVSLGSSTQLAANGTLTISSGASGALNLIGAANSTWSVGSGNALTLTSSNFNVSGGAAVLGSSSVAGSLVLQDGSGHTFNITGVGALTSNQVYSLPTTGGTFCLQSSAACGFIQNQSAAAQAANFYIQGASGTAATAVLAANNGGTGDILDLQNGSGGTVLTINNTGNVHIEPSGAAAYALQVDTTSGNPQFRVGFGQAILGSSIGTNGQLEFLNSTNNNHLILQSGVTSSATVTLTLPTALSGAGSCLTDSTGTGVLAFSSCATGSGTAFIQGGNSFGAQAVLGTNDANSLAFRTSGTNRLVLDTSGNLQFQQASTVSTSTGNLTLQAASTLALGNGVSSAITMDTAAAGTITIGGTNATTTIGNASKALTLNGSSTVVKGTSTSAFQVQPSGGGTPVLNVDTSNNRVGINTASPGATLTINSGVSGTSGLQLTQLNSSSSTSSSFSQLLGVDSSGNVGLSSAGVSLTSPALAYWDGLNDPTTGSQAYPPATLSGNATYAGSGNGVELTTATNFQYGAINWNFSQVPFEESQFQFKAGTGSADSTWFYGYADSIPTTEYGCNAVPNSSCNGTTGPFISSGYIVYFSEYGANTGHGCIGISWGGFKDGNQCNNGGGTSNSGASPLKSINANANGITINDGNWHQVDIQILDNVVTVRWDGRVILTETDVYTRDTSHLNYGFGSRTGGQNNTHFIKGLLVTKLGTNVSEYNINDTSPLTNNITNTANNMYWQNSTGELGINTYNPGANIQVNTSSATETGEIIQGTIGQSGDLLELQNGLGGVLSRFDSSGNLYVPGTIDTQASGGTLNIGTTNASLVNLGTTNVAGNLSVSGSLTGSTFIDAIRTGTGIHGFTISNVASAYYMTVKVNNTATTDTYNITGVSNTEGAIVFIGSSIQKTGTGTTATVQAIVEINGSTLSTLSTTAVGTVTKNYIAMYINGAWRIMGYGNTTSANTLDTADYAEWIDYSGDTAPQPGDVLSVGSSSKTVADSTKPYDKGLVGVVSTSPYEVGGADDGHSVILALTGRVPVKVSMENGPIQAGDPLTSSSTPGVAMKATSPGNIIGTALESYDGTQESDQIMVQLHVGYDDPTAGGGQLQGSQDVVGDLSVGGNTTLQGSQSVAQDLSVGGKASLEGNLTVSGDLNVSGNSTVNSLLVNDALTVNGDLSVSGSANLASLTVQTATVKDSLSVGGSITADSLNVAGSATVQTFTATGKSSFGGDIKLTAKVNTRQATIKQFVASKSIKAGSVVVLDDTNGNAGQVTTTTTADDTRVIGVAVTDANKAGDKLEVAIGGWVQVNVDTTKDQNGNSPPQIIPGQLLTTSANEGTVQANANPKVGSILGKSTSTQDSNNLVWLLITLQ